MKINSIPVVNQDKELIGEYYRVIDVKEIIQDEIYLEMLVGGLGIYALVYDEVFPITYVQDYGSKEDTLKQLF